MYHSFPRLPYFDPSLLPQVFQDVYYYGLHHDLQKAPVFHMSGSKRVTIQYLSCIKLDGKWLGNSEEDPLPHKLLMCPAHESESKFRESYNLLLSMYSWKKDNEYDGVSRAVLRSDMTALGGRIEKLLGLSSRRLGIGVSQQVSIGLDEIYSILNRVKTNPDDTGRDVLR